MNFLNLSENTKVGRVIPKKAFDEYLNTKQKKVFTDCIKRITWTHKLSPETTNLPSRDIQEIQVFKVELKQKSNILKALETISKSIPYHIVFWVEYKEEAYISTASKHPHPTSEDISVIDWIFTSEWFNIEKNIFSLNLRESVDAVFKDLCVQLTGRPDLKKNSLDSILKNQQETERLKKEISRLRSAISKSKQFKEKVSLNLELKEAEKELETLIN